MSGSPALKLTTKPTTDNWDKNTNKTLKNKWQTNWRTAVAVCKEMLRVIVYNYITQQASLDDTTVKIKPPPQKCIWSCYDLDLWPLTLKIFSAMATRTTITYTKFCCNPSANRRRDIEWCSAVKKRSLCNRNYCTLYIKKTERKTAVILSLRSNGLLLQVSPLKLQYIYTGT